MMHDRNSEASDMEFAPIPVAVVMGVPVEDVTLPEALALIAQFVKIGRRDNRTFQIATINVDFVVNARRDPSVQGLLQDADLCLPDGMPIIWSAALQGTPLRERTTGADLVPALVEATSVSGLRVLLFGSAPGVAEKAAEILSARFPGAIVMGLSGPFMRTAEEMVPAGVDEIRSFSADIICIALGNPKQERWVKTFRDQLGIPVLIGVGGTLDFLVGDRRRAPHQIQRFGLEWVYRALQEPRRLGRRYVRDCIVFGPHFLGVALAGLLRSKARYPNLVSARASHGASVEIDCSSLDSLTPRSTASLVGMARHARRAGENVVLTGCRPHVRTALAKRDVDRIFTFSTPTAARSDADRG